MSSLSHFGVMKVFFGLVIVLLLYQLYSVVLA